MNLLAKGRRLRAVAAAAVSAIACLGHSARASDVEVLHWWTSGGEARSVEELKKMLAPQGVTWHDFAVPGGGGDAAMNALHARVDAGHPPTAAQIKGPAIQEWGHRGVLANIDDVASADDWDVKLPRVVAEQMKVDGHWSAVPVNVHRVNWLWINRDLLRKVGGRVPDNWEQFFALAERFKAIGVVPIAHGAQPWQDLTTFEVVTLGVGGPDFYRQTFVAMDPAAWRGATMARIIDTYRRIRQYTDKGASGRDWNAATAMVIRGQAGMQIMGDWAKGEFLAAGKVPETDFVCTAAPGSWNAYIYNIDSFAMFKLTDPQAISGEKVLAKTIMSARFQEIFNRNKGSIPVALGADMTTFDHCARESSGYFVAASLANSLVPSFAHKMANTETKVAGVQAVVARLWDDDGYAAPQAQADLAAIAAASRAR